MMACMAENADDYFHKAREFAAKAAQTDDPSMQKTYSKLAADYVSLARYAAQRKIDTVLTVPSRQRELTHGPT